MEWLRKEKELKMKEKEKSRVGLEGPFGQETDEEKEVEIASKEAKWSRKGRKGFNSRKERK
jgi:hypothetical protein